MRSDETEVLGLAALLTIFALPLAALLCAYSKSGKGSSSSKKSSTSPEGSRKRSEFCRLEDEQDFRPQWAAKTVETQTPKTLGNEFVTLLKDYAAPDKTTTNFCANHGKNRYDDMVCFDESRVVLKNWKTDFIHANHMHAPDGMRYIATQGPLPETKCDFWHMVMQEQVELILQLCRFVEGDSIEKCSEYWPCDLAFLDLGRFKVHKIGASEEIAPGATKCTLRVEGKNGSRTLHHILCDAWPDQLAPTDPIMVVKIWRHIKAAYADKKVVVHCSAGVGRTATFIGISFGVEMLRRQGASTVDVVKELRKYRPKAVQTHIQYTFLNACLIELFIQLNLLERTPAATAFFESFKRVVERKMERKDNKTDRSLRIKTPIEKCEPSPAVPSYKAPVESEICY